jgi:hypothetical protein
MEWFIVIGIACGVIVFFNVRAARAKRRVQAERAQLYNASIHHERQTLLSAPDRTALVPLDPVHHGYRPVAKENLIAVQERASRYELKSSGRYHTAGASLSIPIVKGVRYRVGSGRVMTEKSWQETARGRLLVTDKAVVFESPQKNERITWSQISAVELMLDGYKIAKRTGPPKWFVVDAPDPKFAVVLELMLSRAE